MTLLPVASLALIDNCFRSFPWYQVIHIHKQGRLELCIALLILLCNFFGKQTKTPGSSLFFSKMKHKIVSFSIYSEKRITNAVDSMPWVDKITAMQSINLLSMKYDS